MSNHVENLPAYQFDSEPVERRMMTLHRKREIADRPHDRGQWFRHAVYDAIGGG